ncbi:MAG: ORF6N domain-containing protein [Ferruginibacter sp.]
MQIIKSIQNRIYEIRGERVMIDFDLAVLYQTETKFLKRAVNRNRKRFPGDFMFQLSAEEFESLRYQIGTLETGRGQYAKYLPYAFTEGCSYAKRHFKSDIAIKMNIAIMRVFVEIRKVLLQQTSLKEQLKDIKERLGKHDAQLNQIYDAMENLLNEKAAQRKWEKRQRIGFNQ